MPGCLVIVGLGLATWGAGELWGAGAALLVLGLGLYLLGLSAVFVD